ncbi:MAG: DUF480 domain-containing protein [Planctomycetaceae bacterium]
MSEEPKNEIRQLSRIQRRVLGVLMEKAFTTPEQYPLTLKAATTACNQKSNRDPVSSYSEDQVQSALDELREDLLVAEVFTGGGRTPRYRHYMRHKFDFSEAQFAIIAELLLRGRQQPGELRTRASRMYRIDSQDQLREELASLQEKGFLQSNGPLERRGVEVDHTFYLPKENMNIGTAVIDADDSSETEPKAPAPQVQDAASAPPMPRPTAAPAEALIASAAVENLERKLQEQAELIRGLNSLISDMDDRLQRLERDLGV